MLFSCLPKEIRNLTKVGNVYWQCKVQKPQKFHGVFSKRPTKAFVCSRLVPNSLHEWLLYLVIEALGAVVFSGGTSWPGYPKWRTLDKNDHLLFFILTPSNPSNGDIWLGNFFRSSLILICTCCTCTDIYLVTILTRHENTQWDMLWVQNLPFV